MTDRLDRILALVRADVPGLRLIAKPGHPVLRWVAPGFTTVIGRHVLLARPAEALGRDTLAAILAHEYVHQRDQRRWGLLFYLSYGLALPTGRTVRAVWERRAYAMDLILAHHAGGDRQLDACAARLAGLFSDRSYLWMWAGRSAAASFLAPVVEAVRSGALQAEAPYRDLLAAWDGRTSDA